MAGLSTWKICTNDPFPNCQYVYPIQQRKVSELLSVLKDNKNVQKVIIFGSSVSDRCHMGSDVDLYVALDRDESLHLPVLMFVYDLWTNFSVDERLYKEIKGKGVTVYERHITG